MFGFLVGIREKERVSRGLGLGGLIRISNRVPLRILQVKIPSEVLHIRSVSRLQVSA